MCVCVFVCLFVQYRSHTKVCLVLECDLIVARGKEEEEGREGERERVCVCMYVCVCVCVRGCVLRRVKLLCCDCLCCDCLCCGVSARAPPRDFTSSTCRLFLALSPGLPAICKGWHRAGCSPRRRGTLGGIHPI